MKHFKLFLFLTGANANANGLFRLHHVTPLTSHLRFKHLHPLEHGVHFQISPSLHPSCRLSDRLLPSSSSSLQNFSLLHHLFLFTFLVTGSSVRPTNSIRLYCSLSIPPANPVHTDNYPCIKHTSLSIHPSLPAHHDSNPLITSQSISTGFLSFNSSNLLLPGSQHLHLSIHPSFSTGQFICYSFIHLFNCS